MKTINKVNETKEPVIGYRVRVLLVLGLGLLAIIGYNRSEQNKIETFKVKEYEDRVCVDHNNNDQYTCYDKVAY